jgi:hypothetical protein
VAAFQEVLFTKNFLSPPSEPFVHACKAIFPSKAEGTSKSLADHGLGIPDPLKNICGLTSASACFHSNKFLGWTLPWWYVAGDTVTMVPVVLTEDFCLTEAYEACTRTQSSHEGKIKESWLGFASCVWQCLPQWVPPPPVPFAVTISPTEPKRTRISTVETCNMGLIDHDNSRACHSTAA